MAARTYALRESSEAYEREFAQENEAVHRKTRSRGRNLLKLLRLILVPTRDGLFLLGPGKTVKYFSVSQVARDASFMKPTRGGGGGFLHSGQRAEVVGLYSEDRVELAAKVLKSNHRNQFY
jgi:hypothetical protein